MPDRWGKDPGRPRRSSGTGYAVAALSIMCATLLLVGGVSFSRWQPPDSAAAVAADATGRDQEQLKHRLPATRAAASGSEAIAADPASTIAANDHSDPARRKLSRRPELKTRGGQLAFARFTLLAEYPHDAGAFTQGLCFLDGFLYESTGLLGGKSSVRKVQPETGEVMQIVHLGKQHFGEGMVIVGNQIHSLTWRSRIGFTWDLQTLERQRQFEFNTKTGQGWGITSDGESLIVSDGSQFLLFWDPETMEETRRVEVIDAEGRPVRHLNELEMVHDYVFANVWFDDQIYKIDPNSGDVVDTYNFAELYPKALRKKEMSSKEAVLNGIAWDPEEDVLYVTGKLWPRMYKVKLHEKGERAELSEETVQDPEASKGDNRDRRKLRNSQRPKRAQH